MKVSSEITSLAQLSDEKRKLRARLLEAEDVGALADGQIPVRPAGAALKLSFAQRRIWLLEQLHPNTSVYHIPFVYRLEGPLNVAAVERALAEIVTRHEVLRTSFILDAGEPQQVVRPAHDFQLPLVDLTNIPPDVRALELELLLSEQAQRAFDLSAAAPWRSCLLRLDACEHVLMLVVHHIIADGWSFGVLRRELSLLYDYYNRAQRNGNVLSKLDIQYADYAFWQCQQLAQLDKQLSYWRAQLDGLSPLLQLPMARPRPPHQSYRGASGTFQISPAEAGRLQPLRQ